MRPKKKAKNERVLGHKKEWKSPITREETNESHFTIMKEMGENYYVETGH